VCVIAIVQKCKQRISVGEQQSEGEGAVCGCVCVGQRENLGVTQRGGDVKDDIHVAHYGREHQQ
jgi:hypothetical protein